MGNDREACTVRHRADDFADHAAFLCGPVLYSDQEHEAFGGRKRIFWLLERSIQLIHEPFRWRDNWYAELVEIHCDRDAARPVYTVRDMEIDIIVEGNGPTYRIIELEHFGTRLRAGEFSLDEAVWVLTRTQEFLDAHLQRGGPWPPPEIRPYLT